MNYEEPIMVVTYFGSRNVIRTSLVVDENESGESEVFPGGGDSDSFGGIY